MAVESSDSTSDSIDYYDESSRGEAKAAALELSFAGFMGGLSVISALSGEFGVSALSAGLSAFSAKIGWDDLQDCIADARKAATYRSSLDGEES